MQRSQPVVVILFIAVAALLAGGHALAAAPDGAGPPPALRSVAGALALCPVDPAAQMPWASSVATHSLRAATGQSGEVLTVGLQYGTAEYPAGWSFQNVVAQRLSSSGQPNGQPVTLPLDSQQWGTPVMAYSPASQTYLVVANALTGNDQGEQGRPYFGLFRPDLSLVGRTLSAPTYRGRAPSVAYNPDDDQFLIVWQDEQNLPGPTPTRSPANPTATPTPATDPATPTPSPLVTGLYGTLIRADGVEEGLRSPLLMMQSAADSAASASQALYNPHTHEYTLIGTRDGRLHAQRVARSLEPIGAPIPLAESAARADRLFVAVNSATDQVLLVWSDASHPERLSDVTGLLLAADLTPQGAPFAIRATTAYEAPTALIYNPTLNEYLVAWDTPQGAARRPGLQRLSASGALLGEPLETEGSVALLALAGTDGNVLAFDRFGAQARLLSANGSCPGSLSGAAKSAAAPAPVLQFQAVIRDTFWAGPRSGFRASLFVDTTAPGLGPYQHVIVTQPTWLDERWRHAEAGAAVWVTGRKLEDRFVADTVVVLPAGTPTETPPATSTSTPGPSSTPAPPDLACPRPSGFGLSWLSGTDSSSLQLVTNSRTDEFLALTTRYVTTDTHAITAMRLAPSGEPLIAATDLFTDTLASRPAFAYSPTSDRYLVVWSHFFQQPLQGGSRLMAQVFDSALAPVSAPVTLGSEAARAVSVAYNPDDNEFLVAWHEESGDDPRVNPAVPTPANTATPMPTIQQIIATRRVRPDGSLAGPVVKLVDQPLTIGGQLGLASVQYSPQAGQYVVLWGSVQGSYANRLARDGHVIGAAQLVDNGLHYDQHLVHNSATGEYLVVYLNIAQPGAAPGTGQVSVQAQRLSADLVPLGEPVPLPSTPGYWDIRAATYNRVRNEYLVALRDRVYRLSADGNVLGQAVSVAPDAMAVGVAASGAALVVEGWGSLARSLDFQPHCAAPATPGPSAPTDAPPASIAVWQGVVETIRPSGGLTEWTVGGQSALVTPLTRIETYAGPAEVGARVEVVAHAQSGQKVADVIVVQSGQTPAETATPTATPTSTPTTTPTPIATSDLSTHTLFLPAIVREPNR